MGLRFCKDCKHFDEEPGFQAPLCVRDAKISDPDPVYGYTYTEGRLDPFIERTNGRCGKEALFWEAK